jgi:UDP-N-acetylmuramoyl-L-alanyl-D-glutamate--2,6-diaminopimelate ligase
MKLHELLSGIDARSRSGNLQVEISGVRYDSRTVEPGSVFVAVRGQQVDGNRFIDEAVERGAVAIVSEASVPDSVGPVAWLQVDSDRRALAALASRFYARPTDRLTLVGITGTNGKTTTAHLVESVLQSAGHAVTLLGTFENRGPGFQQRAKLTTPESSDLEQIFRRAVDAGCRYAVMEVSSHSIELKRVEQLSFDVAAFTNLSAEHLDFHGRIEEYFGVKQRLFTGLLGTPPPLAVLNRDDACFEVLRESGNPKCLSFGMSPNADIYPKLFELSRPGFTVEFQTPRGPIVIASELTGRLNLYNVAAAVSIGMGLDLPSRAIVDGIGSVQNVPGRFEFVDRGQPFSLIVDYAHTPDALDKVLSSAREITEGKLIVVFGAGGDRDRSKRQEMGAIAACLSDFAVLTSDNPRSEDPTEIMRMIEKGFPRDSSRYMLVPDRREAIRAAIERASDLDTVVIAGKGHETYQIVGDLKLPFDDRAVARELLDALNAV